MSNGYLIKTGLLELDKIIEGFHPGNLYIIGGRPGTGKTALALTILLSLIEDSIPVGMFSLEISSAKIALKILCMKSKVESRLVSTINLDKTNWKKMQLGINSLSKMPLYIDDSTEFTIDDLKNKTRQLKLNHNISILIIDYLQLIHRRKGVSNRINTKNICSVLKDIAEKNEIPILVTSQLSRKTESRKDKRPELNDFLYVTEIEESADTIMLLYRPWIDTLDEADRELAEVIIAKNRRGPTGYVNLRFIEKCTAFENVT